MTVYKVKVVLEGCGLLRCVLRVWGRSQEALQVQSWKRWRRIEREMADHQTAGEREREREREHGAERKSENGAERDRERERERERERGNDNYKSVARNK